MLAASARKYVLDVALTANAATILPVWAVLLAASARNWALRVALAANAAESTGALLGRTMCRRAALGAAGMRFSGKAE